MPNGIIVFFGGQDIIRLPRLFRFLQRPLAQLISVLRAPKSKEGYAAIGGGSPLRKITDEQVKKTSVLLLVLHDKKLSFPSMVVSFSTCYNPLKLTIIG